MDSLRLDEPVQGVHGHLHKMEIRLPESGVADYRLRADEATMALNACLGQRLRLSYAGDIHCVNCGRRTRKSFGQGHCYPCFSTLARCDLCMMRPETCHYFQGTCREPAWGERHCFRPHIVYLANASGLKVGITRATNMPTRWLDQGAIQALPILEVETRQQSGLVETLFKARVSDRTNWRAMLRHDVEPLDLVAERERLLGLLGDDIDGVRQRFGESSVRSLDAEVLAIDYPALAWPRKIVSFNFDKQAVVEGTLTALKGQYLILDTGVINLRKFAGYRVEVETL